MRLIDADALKEYIGSVRAEFNFFDDDERARYEAHSKAIYLLDLYVNDAPSIDIEPKRGEWIDEADKCDASFGIHDYRCSNCNSYADEYIGGHEWYTMYKPNYCPHCGADMREREGE